MASVCRLRSLHCLLLFSLAVLAQDSQSTTSTTSITSTSTSTSTTDLASSTASSTTTTDSASSTDSVSASASSLTGLPSLTTSSTDAASFPSTTTTSTPSSTSGGLINAPTISSYAIPPLIIPDTSGAPFMQKSNLPEGTVFICVGAALGILGLCVLAWRAWVAWALRRSVQRAALSYHSSDIKTAYHPVPFGGLGGTLDGSNMSLEHLTSTSNSHRKGEAKSKDRSHRRERVKGQQSRTPTSSALFFSPTAGAGAGIHQSSNRASSYLPAGYYASGSVLPAAGASIAHLGGPPAVGYGRIESRGNSPPPDTPSRGSRITSGRELDLQQPDRNERLNRGVGNNTLGVGMSEQRTPSAVLDSWFEHSTAMGKVNRQ